MTSSVRAGEARLYWRAVSNIRFAERVQQEHPTTEQRDDLEVLLIHSNWPRLRVATTAALATFAQTDAAVAAIL